MRVLHVYLFVKRDAVVCCAKHKGLFCITMMIFIYKYMGIYLDVRWCKPKCLENVVFSRIVGKETIRWREREREREWKVI